MTKLETIKNKYDFYFGEGNPETDSIADADTTYLIRRVDRLTEAGSKLGLQCCNIGMYGPLKISPGKCDCSTCNFRKVLEEE